MPFSGKDYFRVFADLLSGGNEFKVSVVKEGAAAPKSVILKFNGKMTGSPEAIASGYFPAAERYAEQYLLKRDFAADSVITLNLQDLVKQGMNLEVTDQEKIRNYVTVSNQNIFSDPNVPISLRIISEETGIPGGTIRDLIESRKVPGVRIVAGDFVQPTAAFILPGDPS